MSPDNPDKPAEPVETETVEEPPPPPPPEPEPPAPAAEKVPEEAWMEDYDELIGPEEESPEPKKRKNRHWGAIAVTIVVLIILVAWTLLSPKIMTQVGRTYVDSERYASWGSHAGTRDIWAGNTTWGLSINGTALADGNRSLEIRVLLTKVSEDSGNWFFRGTSIRYENVSVFQEDGTFVASMSNWTDVGFGLMATVPVTFATNGTYSLYVYAQFTVYQVMRIGFFPLEAVEFEKVYIDKDVVVE